MIVYRMWHRRKWYPNGVPGHRSTTRFRDRDWEGWFLFGIIPLYIRMVKWVVS